jgi:hypothetical protein
MPNFLNDKLECLYSFGTIFQSRAGPNILNFYCYNLLTFVISFRVYPWPAFPILTRLERQRQSCVLRTIVNYSRKKFYNVWSRRLAT